MLKRADLAASIGWSGGPQENGGPITSPVCPGLWDPKQSDIVITGFARSEFSNIGAGMHVSSNVQVYKTIRMAQLDWNRSVEQPGYVSCLKRRFAADPTPKMHLISVKKTPFPRIGQRVAVRFRVITDYTPPAGGAPVRVLFDAVALGRGRTGISFSFSATNRDRALVDAAEARAARRALRRIGT